MVDEGVGGEVENPELCQAAGGRQFTVGREAGGLEKTAIERLVCPPFEVFPEFDDFLGFAPGPGQTWQRCQAHGFPRTFKFQGSTEELFSPGLAGRGIDRCRYLGKPHIVHREHRIGQNDQGATGRGPTSGTPTQPSEGRSRRQAHKFVMLD